jgi:hypothetical protein
MIEIRRGESSRFITAYHFRGLNNLSISPRDRFMFPRVFGTLSKKASWKKAQFLQGNSQEVFVPLT